MLRVDGIPNCCTAKVIHCFGGSNTAMYGRNEKLSKTKMAKELKEKMESVARDGNGIATAFLTSEQKTAIEVVQSLGWKLVSTSKKQRHSETVLHLFAWECCDDEGNKATVENPFADNEQDVFKAALQSVAPIAKQVATAYGIRLPRGRWIEIPIGSLDEFGRRMESSIYKSVAVLTQQDLESNNLEETCAQRKVGTRWASEWRWGKLDSPGDIRYFMILD